MSYDGVQDQDLPLKLRLMNLLWNLGWFVRPNVKLSRYQEGKRTHEQFTDIDVLAIKVMPLHDQIVAVSSAKSGKESDSSELFWLSGVKTYFDADIAYYIRPKANVLRTKNLCEKLGIIAFNEEQFGFLEKKFVSTQDSDYFSVETFKKINGYFVELAEKKQTLHDYLIERYWIDPINNQLLRIITAIRDVAALELSPECKLFFKYYLSSLLAIPLQRFSYKLMQTPASLIGNELDTYLMGGELARGEKEKIVAACRSVALEFGKTVNLNIKNPDFNNLFDNMLQLDFSRELVDLMTSMVQNYKYSAYTPRLLDTLLFQLTKKPTSIPDIRYSNLPDIRKEEWDYATALAKDVLIFVQRIKGFERTEIKI